MKEQSRYMSLCEQMSAVKVHPAAELVCLRRCLPKEKRKTQQSIAFDETRKAAQLELLNYLRRGLKVKVVRYGLTKDAYNALRDIVFAFAHEQADNSFYRMLTEPFADIQAECENAKRQRELELAQASAANFEIRNAGDIIEKGALKRVTFIPTT